MSLGLSKGDAVSKTDLDAIAAVANAKLTPRDQMRTYDMRGGTYPPAVMTGAFAFSDETSSATPRWAWLDELQRIWGCLWNCIMNASDPTVGAKNGDWDSGPESSGTAATRADAYWGSVTDSLYTGKKITSSVGPDFYMDNASTGVKMFNWPRAIYTKEQDAFNIYSGIFASETTGSGDFARYDSLLTAKEETLLGFAGFTGVAYGLWGYIEVMYSAPLGSGDADEAGMSYGLELISTLAGATGGVVAQHSIETATERQFYMYFDTAGFDEDSMIVAMGTYGDISSSLSDHGDQGIKHWVEQSGWVWAATKFRGGFCSSITASTSGTVGSDKIVHPRNESVRAAIKVGFDPHLIDSDILNFPSLDALLSDPAVDPFPVGQRPVDVRIRNMLTIATRIALDEYPTTQPDETVAARPGLLTDFNDLIDLPSPYTIYDSTAWSGVTLRQGTQWFLDLDPQDGLMRQRMMRLLLEDAYDTQLQRLPPTKVAAENEIFTVTLADPIGTATGYAFSRAHVARPDTTKINYLADALPQWCRNTICDYAMPTNSLGDGSTSNGPRGVVNEDSKFPGGTFVPALPVLSTNWPVIHLGQFGRLLDTTETPARNATGYVPYWRCDTNHFWTVYPQHSAIAAGAISYDAQELPIASDSSRFRYEYNARNRNLTLYVSSVDFPDPAVPGSWQLKSNNGYFVFPDDLISLGFTPSDFYGLSLFVTVQNETASAQTFQVVISAFKSLTDEIPPAPEPSPQFFPADEVSASGLGFDVTRSIIYDPAASALGLNLTTPTSGYMITDLVIQRQPKANSAGIYVPDTAGLLIEVKVGIMAGAGVIAGARDGVYPGDFIELGSYFLNDGETEKSFDAMWPVLEGCPLAYYISSGDTSTRLNIFAAVEFQPKVNMSLDRHEAFTGPPWLPPQFLYNINQNVGFSTQGKHRPYTFDNMPPINAKSVNDLYDLLVSLP